MLSFVHPLPWFSVNITSHEKITQKVEMRASDNNHYSCPPSTPLQRLIYESAPPAFITLAFDRQLAPPPACPPVTQPKTPFVPLPAPRSTSTGGGPCNKASPGRVPQNRPEQRQSSPGDCTDEFSLKILYNEKRMCIHTSTQHINNVLTPTKFSLSTLIFFSSLHTYTHNKNLHSSAWFVSNQ